MNSKSLCFNECTLNNVFIHVHCAAWGIALCECFDFYAMFGIRIFLDFGLDSILFDFRVNFIVLISVQYWATNGIVDQCSVLIPVLGVACTDVY